jgi:glycosyltransferase involved in cell wall biosynthesis
LSDSGRQRILIVHPVLPYPPDQGSKVATFGLIRSLADQYDVTVLCKIDSAAELAHAHALEQHCKRVVTVQAPNKRSPVHRLAYKVWYTLVSYVRRRSFKSLYDTPGALLKAARRLSMEDFDLNIVIYWQLYPVFRLLRRDKTILATYDIDLHVNKQLSLHERHLFRKLQTVRNWLIERREEINAYRSVSRVWTLTERDKRDVENITRNECRVDVMPFRLDTAFFAPPGMARNEGELLFLGFLRAPFNRDALEYFVNKIYPHLDDIEGLSITVVGGELPEDLAHFGLNPEVEIVGRVPDIRPYLHRAACIVIPLRFAGGLRIRILEAMAAGVPVVCTAEAIAGMDFEAEEHYLLADTPGECARQIARVLGDRGLAGRLSESAIRAVRERYGAEAQARRTNDLVRSVLARG